MVKTLAVITKQTSNFLKFLPKFLKQNVYKRSKRIVLAFLVAFLFLPIVWLIPVSPVAVQEVQAQPVGCDLNRYYQGEVRTNKSTVSAAENFDIYFKFVLDSETVEACRSAQVGSVAFSPWLYKWACLPGDYSANVQLSYEATFFDEGGSAGFHALIKDVNLNKLGYSLQWADTTEFCVYGYYHGRTESANIQQKYITAGGILNRASYATLTRVNTNTPNPVTSTLPSIPASQLITIAGGGQVVDYTQVGISIKPDAGGKGLRGKYRILWDDGDLNFGVTGGLDGIHMDWANQQSIMLSGVTQFKLPQKDDGWGFDNDPYYYGAAVYFNYARAVQNLSGQQLVCMGTSFGTDCSRVFFRETDGSDKGKGHGSPSLPPQSGLQPSIKTAAWQASDSGVTPPTAAQRTSGNNGQPLGKIDFVAIPAIGGASQPTVWNGSWGVLRTLFVNNSVTLVAGSGNLKPFSVEVFANLEDLKTACRAEQQSAGKDPAQCDNENFARYQFADTITQTTTPGEEAADGTVSKLFNFIRSVIAYIVLLLTSFIYYIFSIILVPVLVALLQIQAYKDNFVNFIYPGWVIIRNISNILFIIALLWIGLRTLFQVDDASKSRSFIVRLILMALLVNFSLVIGQAIVGIADTVQAQFLPKDSRVVEALGHKLMVDPIITFRGGSDSLADPSGNFTSDSFASDLPKAIILLVLAVAAFFAFVALIAFIFVRLGMLWLLYMLSPLAYVAQILPETKEYGKKWFTEFLRYAFVVPILAFFLNMTALIAVTFSRTSGDQVQVEGSGTTALGGLVPTGDAAAGIVEFAVTVMSHFIVLVFLFGGMAFAQKFGGVGSKQIVSFAKKGFDAVTKRPAMWAARGAGSYGKEKYERKIAGGLFDPKAWKQVYKDRVAETTKNKKLDRISRKGNKLSPGNILPAEGSLKDRGKHIGKYMWAKLSGQDPHGLLAAANAENEKASIMTNSELRDARTNLANHTLERDNAERDTTLLANDTISDERADKYADEIDKKISDIESRQVDLVSKRDKLRNQGRTGGEEYKQIEDELVSLSQDRNKLIDAETALDAARANSPARGAAAGTVKLEPGELDDLKVVFDKDSLKGELSDALNKANKTVEKDQKKLDRDSELRQKYNTPVITDAEKLALERSAIERIEKAQATYMPLSQAAIEARRSLQSDQAKKIEHIDDVDALVSAHKEALSKNNTALAVEIQKKLAKVGGMDELLKSEGYGNNLKDFQQFIEKSFSRLAPQVRVQIGSEISQVAKTNGNLTLGNSANYSYNKSTGETAIKWAPPEESTRKLNAKLKGTQAGSLAAMQKTDLAYEEAGVHKLHEGVVENLNSMNPKTLDNFIRRSSPSLRTFIMKAGNKDRLSNTVRAKLTTNSV